MPELRMESFGDRIRSARINKRLTQEELAELVDVSRVSIAKYESGEMEPKLRNFKMIADVLDVSADYLLDRKRSGLKGLSMNTIHALENLVSKIAEDTVK